MNVLVVGGGGREHALAWKLRQSARLGELWIAPGNPGTAALGRGVALAADDVAGLTAFARDERIDLVVVGPEAALAAGLADALAAAGIACFGPTAAAARIESSKAFSKELMRAAGVPTGDFAVFERASAAAAWLASHDWRRWRVAKQDGLAAGKGVVVAATERELRDTLAGWDRGGQPVLLEAPLAGEEISVLALCDGTTARLLVPAQDHKRLRDGDTGPNTGGMGAYAPVAHVDPALVAALEHTVFVPTLRELARRGTPFVGVLYAGIMLTDAGPQVLEFNARFGDPETQALLPLLDADLLELLLAAVRGELAAHELRWHSGAAVGVVLAAAGYPATPRAGDPIALPADPSALIFQAGTAERDGQLVTAGGRVLTVVGRGATLQAARDQAYAAATEITFDGQQLRHDIARRGLEAEHA